ncbi:MAG: UvrD-helicase domain-containing protein, partial [Pseudobdellovibrionaceae bacterium]
AGAGKTTDLIFTFISFCEEFHKIHNRFPKVVLCTFTRKATLEIRERINKQLLAENKIDLYFHVQKKNHVLISTIHGVFYQFLQHTFKHQRQTHHQFNFDPQIQLKSSQDFFSFKRNLLRKIIFSSKEN